MTLRDIRNAAWDIAKGLLGIAILAWLFFVAGAMMCGCAPPRPRTVADLPAQTELEQRVAAAGIEAWRAAGLRTTPAVRELYRLRIERPATPKAYDARCPAALLGRSWACLRWSDWDVPVAVISPRVTDAMVPHLALHELVHALVYRTGLHADYDGGHTDRAVWGAAGVEGRAQRILDGPLIGAAE